MKRDNSTAIIEHKRTQVRLAEDNLERAIAQVEAARRRLVRSQINLDEAVTKYEDRGDVATGQLRYPLY